MKVSLNTNQYLSLNNQNLNYATSFKSQHNIDLFIKENSKTEASLDKESSYFSKLIAIKKLNKQLKKEGILDNSFQCGLLKNDVEKAISSNPVEALKKFKIIKDYPDYQYAKYLYVRVFLGDENLTANTLKQLFDFGDYVHKTYRPVAFFKVLKAYEDFDSHSNVINSQNEFKRIVAKVYEIIRNQEKENIQVEHVITFDELIEQYPTPT